MDDWAVRSMTVVAFLAVGVRFAPDSLVGSSGGPHWPVVATAAKIAHIFCFSASFGAALWGCCIGGIILYKHLPRNTMAKLQLKYLPAYYSWVTVCAAVCVAAFAHLHPWKSASSLERYQIGFLFSSLGCFLSKLVFCPMIMEMGREMLKIQGELSDKEVGSSNNIEMAKKNPNRASMKEKYQIIQLFCLLTNIISLGCLAMHSCYVAGKMLH